MTSTKVQVRNAVMVLAEADHWDVDKVFEELWIEAQEKKIIKNKLRFILASDIAVLVRNRLEEKGRYKSEYERLKEEFNTAVKKLQMSCSHSEITDWMKHYMEPGHIEGEVRFCKRCGLKVSGRGFASKYGS